MNKNRIGYLVLMACLAVLVFLFSKSVPVISADHDGGACRADGCIEPCRCQK